MLQKLENEYRMRIPRRLSTVRSFRCPPICSDVFAHRGRLSAITLLMRSGSSQDLESFMGGNRSLDGLLRRKFRDGLPQAHFRHQRTQKLRGDWRCYSAQEQILGKQQNHGGMAACEGF